MQQEASQIMRRAEALIERCCDELSASDRLHRIDRLELDLGHLDPQRLEEELLAKFGESLRRGLAEQIGRQESGDPTPMIAPVMEWVVLMGTPPSVFRRMVVAAAVSAEKPW